MSQCGPSEHRIRSGVSLLPILKEAQSQMRLFGEERMLFMSLRYSTATGEMLQNCTQLLQPRRVFCKHRAAEYSILYVGLEEDWHLIFLRLCMAIGKSL